MVKVMIMQKNVDTNCQFKKTQYAIQKKKRKKNELNKIKINLIAVDSLYSFCFDENTETNSTKKSVKKYRKDKINKRKR